MSPASVEKDAVLFELVAPRAILEAFPSSPNSPSSGTTSSGVESIRLESLVHHRQFVENFVALELTYDAFRTRKVEYMAVVREEHVIGLCSRGQVGFVLGSRFGFALYSHSPIETVMVPHPLIVSLVTPVREVLDRALARRGDGFHEDVVLVDARGHLVGLIQAETLAQLQSRLVAEQLETLRRQSEILREQNLELFRAAHAVRQSQGLYLGLFEGHALGVALLDVDGGVHEHNRRLTELLGFESSTASVLSLGAWIDEKERQGFLGLLQSQARGAAAASREFTFHLSGRGARTFRCSTGWIKETGQICACLDDITDQRVLERQLLRQEKQILLDTLVGGIAHELNNKLTPVQGFAELLGLQVTGDSRRHAQHIQTSVAEAAHIIRQLLQLSKPAAAASQLVDLRSVLEETVLMLKFQIRAARCEVQTRLPAEPVSVLGDPAQLKQVTLNLALNALQAMEGRPNPRLQLEVVARDTLAVLRVSDTGCGISPENLARIFDPFFTTKGPERGTGLGLSVCFSIVRQHGGEIAVESRPGEGAQFTVSLPTAATTAGSPTLAPTPAATPSDHARGVRVLVVEDDDVVRLVLQEMLRGQLGCDVTLAQNGVEALAVLQQESFALVLSDIQMPLMNGTELFVHVNEQMPDMAKRFVFITGYPGGREHEAEIAKWGVPVLTKPFTLPRLGEICGPFLRAGEDGAVRQF